MSQRLALGVCLLVLATAGCGNRPAPKPTADVAPEPGQAHPPDGPAPAAAVALEKELRDAAFAGATDEVRAVLLSGAGVDAQDGEGRSALMLAAFNGHVSTVALLLERGGQPDLRDSAGRTALMYASSGPFAEAVELLLGHGADPNLKDSGEGWTALMFAAGEGQLEVVQALLRHGADAAARDGDGDAAIDHARRRGRGGVVELLEAPRGAPAATPSR